MLVELILVENVKNRISLCPYLHALPSVACVMGREGCREGFPGFEKPTSGQLVDAFLVGGQLPDSSLEVRTYSKPHSRPQSPTSFS